jgi:hypothetical protein
MSNHHVRSDPHQYHKVAERFDHRAVRLRRQANIFLAIIIVVLVGGAAAFVFANDIASLSFQPRTAEAQVATVREAIKQNNEELVRLNNQVSEIEGVSSISTPFNEKLTKATSEYSDFENSVLQRCVNILHTGTDPDRTVSYYEGEAFNPDDISIRPSDRVGEYQLSIPGGKSVIFSNQQSASDCRVQFLNKNHEITNHLKTIQNIYSDKVAALQDIIKNKQSEIAPLQQRLNKLREGARQLYNVLPEIESRAVQERVLGPPLITEARTASEKTDGKTDWARVIETNATRIGALVTMFFLVTILVPQYRYNIRMASFYEARSDSIALLSPDETGPDDLDKVVAIMTPNIDFGKAPPTPWEQIIEGNKDG